jgi:hypothetical protein
MKDQQTANPDKKVSARHNKTLNFGFSNCLKELRKIVFTFRSVSELPSKCYVLDIDATTWRIRHRKISTVPQRKAVCADELKIDQMIGLLL